MFDMFFNLAPYNFVGLFFEYNVNEEFLLTTGLFSASSITFSSILGYSIKFTTMVVLNLVINPRVSDIYK